MESLLRELVSNVLSRLPAKELMRCKCVCKSWFDLITDPHFISNYYIFYNSRRKQEHLLHFSTNIGSLFPIESEISILSWNSDELGGLISSRVINPPPYQEFCGHIMGPCNGIYYIEGYPNVIVNPSLRKFIPLPHYYVDDPLEETFYSHCSPGFGFDPKNNDYKVVVLKDKWIEKHKRLMGVWRVELYSLNSNSWRNLGTNAIPFPLEISDSSQFWTYVHNCCHWWGSVYEFDKSKNDVEDIVLSFDMVTELFRKIKVPKSTHSSGRGTKNIIPLSESTTIGVVDYCSRYCHVNHGTDEGLGFYFCFDVWTMKDYWDEGSWIKRYSVGPMPDNGKLLVGYYGSNQFLWKDTNKRRLVLCELDCEEHTRDLCVYEYHDESIKAVIYMESLVSLQRVNQSSSNQ